MANDNIRHCDENYVDMISTNIVLPVQVNDKNNGEKNTARRVVNENIFGFLIFF